MATKDMDKKRLSENFPASYPEIEWTIEEEEAFNRITPMEWPKPTLRTRFARAVKNALAPLGLTRCRIPRI